MTKKPSNYISQDTLARGFIDKQHRDLRFDNNKMCWYRWNGYVWRVDETNSTPEDIRKFVNQLTQKKTSRTALPVSLAVWKN
jgi:hypothetical protein